MLVIWRDPPYTHDQEQHVHDAPELDRLLDRLHRDAAAVGHPNAVILYAGNHYPQEAHGGNGSWIPADPGDGGQPELILTVGTGESPLYWDEPGGTQNTSHGPRVVTQWPESEYYFQYLYGGQESYATESSLVPAGQAREAARLFLQKDGKRPGNVAWQPQPDASRDALTRLDLDEADMAEVIRRYDTEDEDGWFHQLGDALADRVFGEDISAEVRELLLQAAANTITTVFDEQRRQARNWEALLGRLTAGAA